MKLGRNVEIIGKAINNATPTVKGIRNIKIPLIMVNSVTSSPASALTTKKLVATGGATIPTMQSAVMMTPNQIGS
jgi:hypothetical protein